MIHYTLVCADGHEFDGWFRNSTAFDEQVANASVSCPECGSTEVSKGIMAPNVATGGKRDLPGEQQRRFAHMQRMRQFLTEWRSHVERTCDYVGDRFPEEARRIHYGETETRNIYGEATIEEAKGLVEEGVEIAPVPPAPKQN